MSDNKKAGTMTLAVGMILFGVILMVSNFVGIKVFLTSLKFWPLLLIVLGIEFFVRKYFNDQRESNTETKFHLPSLIFILLLASGTFITQQAVAMINVPEIKDAVNDAMGRNNVSYTNEIKKDMVINQSNKLIVDVPNAQVSMLPSSDGKLHVKAEVTGWGNNTIEARQKAEAIKINLEEGQIISLSQSELPNHINNRSTNITYRIMVPKGLNTIIKNRNGDIKAETINANLDIESGTGKTTLSRINGNVLYKGEHGDAFFNEISGSLQAMNESGNIHIINTNHNVTVDNKNGEIDYNVTVPFSGISDITNDSGNITVKILPNSNVNIKARTDNGEIYSTLSNITVVNGNNNRKQSVDSTIGSGLGKLSIVNHNGDIKFY